MQRRARIEKKSGEEEITVKSRFAVKGMRMGLKSKLFGLGAALTMGLTLVGPAAASSNVPIKVSVADAGTAFTIGFSGSTSVNFGNVNLNANQATNNGVKPAGDVVLTLSIDGDTSLDRPGANVTLQLVDNLASPNGAYLPLTSAAPTFEGADQVNFQIPGRYLAITNVTNPFQLKATGNGTWCTPSKWWAGSNNAATNNCVPKVASGTPHTGNQPATSQTGIYKVGDVVGLWGVSYSPSGNNCQIVGSANDGVGCNPVPFDGANNNSPTAVMHIRPGSGTVKTTEDITLSLGIPAGVYPGTYQGYLILDQTASS
jgi:hypothetical protein